MYAHLVLASNGKKKAKLPNFLRVEAEFGKHRSAFVGKFVGRTHAQLELERVEDILFVDEAIVYKELLISPASVEDADLVATADVTTGIAASRG